jgi:hypothetical protein
MGIDRFELTQMNEDDQQEPINNPIGSGLEVGLRRPRFRRDAPPWFTLLVFAFIVGVILASFLL